MSRIRHYKVEAPTFDMLLRDQFACYAIACAAWASDAKNSAKEIAKQAYDLADFMLKERKRRTK